MEGKFIGIAHAILRAASDEGLKPEQVAETIGQEKHDEINCYPGNPAHECYPLAVFVSLHGRLANAKKKWGDYNFENILQAIIKHVQGACPDVTRDIVLITDTWNALSFEKWQANIDTIIRSGVNVEVYLIGYPNLINPIKDLLRE